jgi:hypothetical protein
MSTLFNKLNLKDQTEMLVVNAPESFEAELAQLNGVTIKRALKDCKAMAFCLVFVTKQAEVNKLAPAVIKKAQGDAVIWFAYPKGTSKKYKCDFNRDTGWQVLGDLGYEGVRMVAIDEDWSALRFRNAVFIKTMTRSFAMSEEGKAKAKKK